MKLAADCKRCGREFVRPLNYAGTMEFCSTRCRNARLTSAGKKTIAKRVAEVGRCERCSSERKLHGHHRISRVAAPLLVADPNNIEVLCEVCHGLEHKGMSFTKRWLATAVH